VRNWDNLGKKRSDFGKWLDSLGLYQRDVEENTESITRTTISRMCNDNGYKPKYSTIHEVRKSLKKLGYNLDTKKFWDI
jgi:hypothetical protein